jgi:hypothetical protein
VVPRDYLYILIQDKDTGRMSAYLGLGDAHTVCEMRTDGEELNPGTEYAVFESQRDAMTEAMLVASGHPGVGDWSSRQAAFAELQEVYQEWRRQRVAAHPEKDAELPEEMTIAGLLDILDLLRDGGLDLRAVMKNRHE